MSMESGTCRPRASRFAQRWPEEWVRAERTLSEPGHELAQGLYGPFLVMEPRQRWDPETDRLFLLGSLGATLRARIGT